MQNLSLNEPVFMSMGVPANLSPSDGIVNIDLGDRLKQLNIDPRSPNSHCTTIASSGSINKNSCSYGHPRLKRFAKSKSKTSLSSLSRRGMNHWNDNSGDDDLSSPNQLNTFKRRDSRIALGEEDEEEEEGEGEGEKEGGTVKEGSIRENKRGRSLHKGNGLFAGNLIEEDWDDWRKKGSNRVRKSKQHDNPSRIRRQQQRHSSLVSSLHQSRNQSHHGQSRHRSDPPYYGRPDDDNGYVPVSSWLDRIKISSLFNDIQSQFLHYSRLTKLTLLHYEFHMDDILETLHVLSSLESLDLYIISVLSLSYRSDRQHPCHCWKDIQHNDGGCLQGGCINNRGRIRTQQQRRPFSHDETQIDIDQDENMLDWEGKCMSQESGDLDNNINGVSGRAYTCDSCTWKLQRGHRFPNIRSLAFRGTICVPELLRFLPNLETLSLVEGNDIQVDTGQTPSGHAVYDYGLKYNSASNNGNDNESRSGGLFSSDYPLNVSSRCGPYDVGQNQDIGTSQIALMMANLAQSLREVCSRLTRLMLTEPQLIDDSIEELDRAGRSQPTAMLLQSVPQLLEFVTNIEVLTKCPSLIDTLLKYHRHRLCSFKILDNPQGRVVSFPKRQQQHHHHQGNKAVLEGQNPPLPPESLFRLRQRCLQVFENCQMLETFECKVPLPLEDVITSVPKWVCGSTLKVLQFEIYELTEEGGLDSEEEELMQMFTKSLFKSPRWLSHSDESQYTDDFSRSTSCSPQQYLSADLSAAGSTSTGTIESESRSSSSSSSSEGRSNSASPGDLYVAGSGDSSSSASSSQESKPEPPYLSLGVDDSNFPSNVKSGQSLVTDQPQIDDGYNAFTGSSYSSGDSNNFGRNRHHQRPHRHQRSHHPYQSDHHHRLHRNSPVYGHEMDRSRWPIPALIPPPIILNGMDSPFVNISPSNYQINVVGRLVALQYLVEHQLIYFQKLHRFFWGNVCIICRKGK